MNLYTSYFKAPVGLLEIQSSDKYIKSVSFVEEETVSYNGTHKLLQICQKQLDEYFSGKRKSFNLPINQDGTVFQMKIWDLLYRIPYGNTISYYELSRQYGDTGAVRAVAGANGKNNLAIIVPCHRVIGSNQALMGYMGGISRKKWLLDHEARYHHGVQEFAFK